MICCPKCGNKIKVWKEYLVTREQVINPNTGELGRIKMTDRQEIDSMIGVCCTKCDWLINTVNNTLDEQLTVWWDNHEKDFRI